MAFVAGDAFAESGRYLAILMLAGGAVFYSALFGHAVVSLGLQRKTIWIYAMTAVTSVAAYFALIPRLGAPAAAWVTVYSEVLVAALTAWFVTRASGVRPRLSVAWRAAAASLAMAAAIMLVPGLHVTGQIGLGALTYFAALYAFGGIDRETVAMLRRRA